MKAKLIALGLGIGAIFAAFWYFFLTGDEEGGNKSITRKQIKIKKAEIDDIKKKEDNLQVRIEAQAGDSGELQKEIDDLEEVRAAKKAEIQDLADDDLLEELGDLLGQL